MRITPPWAASGWPVRVRDLALIGVCAYLTVTGLEHPATSPGPDWLLATCIGIGCVLLWWRRRSPFLCLVITVSLLSAYFAVFGAPESGGMLVMLIALLYAVARWEPDRRRAPWVLAIMAVFLVLHEWRDPANTSWHQLMLALPYDALALCAWLLGAFVRNLSEQRASAAARIAAEERTRIARELHDIVAHGIGVMVLQAEGAAEVVGHDPERARRAMERVADSGRASLVELRRALGALRDPAGAATAPQPGLAMLEELLATVRSTGLCVELETSGDLPGLSAGVDLAAYRVIQEALTNTLRHAEATRAHVRLHHGDDRVELEVRDDGRGVGGRDPRAHDGRGLLGMRERVGLLGGSLEAGPALGGGFQVTAVLPTGGGA
ncbi:MAG TPA: sensor histidine kinase [Nocardioidaceae bacterium]|nr:sensor histidine kinase [Nocardioidaceae bacterium]